MRIEASLVFWFDSYLKKNDEFDFDSIIFFNKKRQIPYQNLDRDLTRYFAGEIL